MSVCQAFRNVKLIYRDFSGQERENIVSDGSSPARFEPENGVQSRRGISSFRGVLLGLPDFV